MNKKGGTVGNMRVVYGGLAPDQLVIVKGMQKAIPGKHVTPQKQAASRKEPAGPASSPPATAR